ncbi:RNA-binding domain-containing protein [Exidia glandulosa HHB12029]|uniref:RNA-binding domain-containing protein n=1 Tax=Exidia glandulosa HHB12029 TaxID=1314781 RepID=A0A165QNX4_EXIGL|nr:RNA-binding domain-containing protein [Exidia glandulosa HHB12029]
MSEAPAAPAPVAQNAVEETPGHKVFAGNLAYSTTDEGLKAFFAPVQSGILSAQVILRGTRSAGYGFVAFATAEAAENAVALLNKKELDGREVIVEVAKPAEIKDKERSERRASKKAGRRGNKAPTGEVTEAEANGEAAKADAPKPEGDAAKPKKKKAPVRRKKKAKTPADGAAAPEAAAATDGTTPAAEPKKKAPKAPRKPKVTRPAGVAPEGEPSKNMLFVANLGFTIDDAGLEKLFTDAGITVSSARVVRRRWGQPRKSKGYGFVDVGSEEEQKKAIDALQGKEVAGRELAVKIAVNASEAEKAEEAAAEARNRKRSRRELEEEARQEGLSTSLFARAQEHGDNKAMSMMMKMGFKIGQSLGRADDDDDNDDQAAPQAPTPGEVEDTRTQHRVDPLPVQMWQGRKGVGLGKRAASPGAGERLAKVARVADDGEREDFRVRARSDWEDRRAEGRLASARRTCLTLDEKAGKDFNVIWLDPRAPASFPAGLLDALETDGVNLPELPDADDNDNRPDVEETGIPTAALAMRLRREMRAYKLSSGEDPDDTALDSEATAPQPLTFSPETISDATKFLMMSPVERLAATLAYLRQEYLYCFWCGAQYEDAEDLQRHCPGEDEDSHD